MEAARGAALLLFIMPLSTAEKAALEGFLRSKRGEIEHPPIRRATREGSACIADACREPKYEYSGVRHWHGGGLGGGVYGILGGAACFVCLPAALVLSAVSVCVGPGGLPPLCVPWGRDARSIAWVDREPSHVLTTRHRV